MEKQQRREEELTSTIARKLDTSQNNAHIGKRPQKERHNMYCQGMVEEQVLISSCPRTIVQRYQEKFQEGKAITIRCTHGDTTLCPSADIEMEVEDVPI